MAPLTPGQAPMPSWAAWNTDFLSLGQGHGDREEAAFLRPPTSSAPAYILRVHPQDRSPAPYLTQGLSLVTWGMVPRSWSS